jgi:hypothetical protein
MNEHIEILIVRADEQAVVMVVTEWDDGDADAHSERSFTSEHYEDYLGAARAYAVSFDLPVIESFVI